MIIIIIIIIIINIIIILTKWETEAEEGEVWDKLATHLASVVATWLPLCCRQRPIGGWTFPGKAVGGR